ncbi:MAG: hypothetical protein ACRCX8_12535 [Sarcina sp.]
MALNSKQIKEVTYKINRAGNSKKLKLVLDIAIDEGYVSEKWFTKAFEAQTKFIRNSVLLTELKEALGEISEAEVVDKDQEEAAVVNVLDNGKTLENVNVGDNYEYNQKLSPQENYLNFMKSLGCEQYA